jgi:hypothetical protein
MTPDIDGLDDLDFAVFEAVCGVQGDLSGCCGAEAPWLFRRVRASTDGLPCSRAHGHKGDHVAAHATTGAILARWPAGYEGRR